MSLGVRQPRPDTREQTKSQLTPHVMYANTFYCINGVYKLPKQMTPVELKFFMAANGKTDVSVHPDYTGHERGAKSDKAGKTQYHDFHDGERMSQAEMQIEIVRRMKAAGIF